MNEEEKPPWFAKEMQGFAILPNGQTKWLIRITRWDFNWQGDYRYAEPVFLPKGSELRMRFIYDNSAENIQNPNSPPRRVVYGPQSSDEMGELWFQVLPRKDEDRQTFARAYQIKSQHVFLDYAHYLLKTSAPPERQARAYATLARDQLQKGNRLEAIAHFREAARIAPRSNTAHYDLGIALMLQGDNIEAKAEFEETLRINPDDFRSHGSLGIISLRQGLVTEAESHFRNALRLNPNDSTARDTLDKILKAKAGRQQNKKAQSRNR